LSLKDKLMEVQGVAFDELLTNDASGAAIAAVLSGGSSCGLQASQFGAARLVVQRIFDLKRRNSKCSVFVSYTSNLVSCGLRETLAYLAKHRLVDGFVSTGGGVEEDVIKCLGQTLLGDFALRGADLRKQGLNRIGNLLVPNDNYCAFENFFVPVIESLHKKQRDARWASHTTPSEIITALGAAMEDLPLKEDSVVYWCYRNNIPLFCPALTDGSIGDMIYFYNFSKKGFLVDPIPDAAIINQMLGAAEGEACVICLGGGLPKHHIVRALKHAPTTVRRSLVMVTTGLDVDGCASSCNISDDATHGYTLPSDTVVRVHGDASLLFPLML
jgi:deoxyhypusine synthase